MKTIQLTIEEDLLSRVNHAVQQQQTTWSEFLRASLLHYLEQLQIKEMEKRHHEGYSKQPVQAGEFDVWENEQAWSE